MTNKRKSANWTNINDLCEKKNLYLLDDRYSSPTFQPCYRMCLSRDKWRQSDDIRAMAMGNGQVTERPRLVDAH